MLKSKRNREASDRGARLLVLPAGIALIVGLTVLSGYLQGTMARRWGHLVDLVSLGKALDNFPDEIGPWQRVSSDTLSEPVAEVLECTGYVLRDYVNPETGERISIGLLIGPSGPMTVHTPDICYSSQAYNRVDQPHPVRITDGKGKEGEFWRQTFKAKSLDGELLRVYYGWRSGGVWQAATNARMTLARHPYLYKIQVAAPLLNLDTETDPGMEFLQEFLAVEHSELQEI